MKSMRFFYVYLLKPLNSPKWNIQININQNIQILLIQLFHHLYTHS